MITVYGGKNCSACEGVKNALDAEKIEYEYYDVFDKDMPEEHKNIFFGRNFRSIPQLFNDHEYLGNAMAVSDILAKHRGDTSE